MGIYYTTLIRSEDNYPYKEERIIADSESEARRIARTMGSINDIILIRKPHLFAVTIEDNQADQGYITPTMSIRPIKVDLPEPIIEAPKLTTGSTRAIKLSGKL